MNSNTAEQSPEIWAQVALIEIIRPQVVKMSENIYDE